MEQVTKFDIPVEASDIVIFVHGFGVRWDSRGMLTDIQKSLPDGWGSVLFDFYEIDGNKVYVKSIENQVDRLRYVINKVKTKSPEAVIHIIAHSKGCIITALSEIEVNGKVIFLAPPEKFGSSLKSYFMRYPGAQKSDTEIIIPRKDNTITHIPLKYFNESAQINAEKAILNYSKKHIIHILQTTEDEVIGKTNYSLLQNKANIHIKSLPADHNFTGKNRDKLINKVKEYLNA